MPEQKKTVNSSEIERWEKKLDYIIAECDLMVKKHDKTSPWNESTKKVQAMLDSGQNFISEQVGKLKKELKKEEEDIKEQIEEFIVEKAKGVVATKITEAVIINPVKEEIHTLDKEINRFQNKLQTLTQTLDTQDKSFFARTIENTSSFIKKQKDNVIQMHEQFKATGSIKTNLQQLTDSIPETHSSTQDLLTNPSKKTLYSALTAVGSTASFFMRYLNEKCDKTIDIAEEGSEKIEKSIEKHKGIYPYAKSLVKKADSLVEQNIQRINQLDKLNTFYQNTVEFKQKIESSLRDSSNSLAETIESKSSNNTIICK
ncbi:Uncharacterised protein [Legionella busanensis]|uniref:Uncharacterized protein n=1 Tax=Legionella busanensis TaxID=190655 RepID=A0A378JNB8_9GAMM|nr:hypothetical protein [Legionella busanensis]STX52866.1 Uncharacterised protein [Legionella busanensis]